MRCVTKGRGSANTFVLVDFGLADCPTSVAMCTVKTQPPVAMITSGRRSWYLAGNSRRPTSRPG